MICRTIFAALLMVVVGCGGGAGKPPIPLFAVKGTVTTADGTPVHRATMKFTPIDPNTGRDDLLLLENGKYATRLLSAKYKVSFESMAGGTPIPKKYATATSTLEIDGTKETEADFQLK